MEGKEKNGLRAGAEEESVSVGNWLITDDRGCDDPLEGLFFSLSLFAFKASHHPAPFSHPPPPLHYYTGCRTRMHAYIYTPVKET